MINPLLLLRLLWGLNELIQAKYWPGALSANLWYARPARAICSYRRGESLRVLAFPRRSVAGSQRGDVPAPGARVHSVDGDTGVRRARDSSRDRAASVFTSKRKPFRCDFYVWPPRMDRDQYVPVAAHAGW